MAKTRGNEMRLKWMYERVMVLGGREEMEDVDKWCGILNLIIKMNNDWYLWGGRVETRWVWKRKTRWVGGWMGGWIRVGKCKAGGCGGGGGPAWPC